IKGPTAVQEYLVDETQAVYRQQGVKLSDKHIEVIVRQMMQKVDILDAGDTIFLEMQAINKWVFRVENDRILDMKVVEDAGGSATYKPGQMLTNREFRDENSKLKREDLKIMKASVQGKEDTLEGLKENVIVGHLIPAGTGKREYQNLIVGSKIELEAAQERILIENRKREYVD
ncbi:UNVERIFIED_CONTAM: hypothetical protein GTU68_017638, partial [Idotea baltica]|nr:hypothetical protein [Idotea baltica]